MLRGNRDEYLRNYIHEFIKQQRLKNYRVDDDDDSERMSKLSSTSRDLIDVGWLSSSGSSKSRGDQW